MARELSGRLTAAGAACAGRRRPTRCPSHDPSHGGPRSWLAGLALGALVCLPACGPAVDVGSPARDAASRPAGPAPTGMLWIPGGSFLLGDPEGRADERPARAVQLSGFWMDRTEVTNTAFAAFVADTGHVTTAERAPLLDEIMAQLPPGTPPPPADVLVPGSLVFRPPPGPVSLRDVSAWWAWVPGADWRHPEGPGSDLSGRDEHPVVHVSWDDARAYAVWAGKRLPTEAEWEWAARGGLEGQPYSWGDAPPAGRANLFQGSFPHDQRVADGYAGSAPVGRFAANDYGLVDMGGNVWEWCQDWYRADAYARLPEQARDPGGPADSHDPAEPGVPKRVQRGGSFLCHESYCAGYRVAARMKTSPDTSLVHSGFRCARDP